MNLHKLTENLRNMTDELNSIEGVEVTSTHELMKERDALRAENAQLKEDLEQEMVKLACCLCAAEGAGEIVNEGDYGWSPAYQAVFQLRQYMRRILKERKG